jgi:hypothetical protein
MVAPTDLFDFKICSGESISTRVFPVGFFWKARTVNDYRVVVHNDVIAWKPDQAFDVMDGGIGGQTEHNDVAALRVVRGYDLQVEHRQA